MNDTARHDGTKRSKRRLAMISEMESKESGS